MQKNISNGVSMHYVASSAAIPSRCSWVYSNRFAEVASSIDSFLSFQIVSQKPPYYYTLPTRILPFDYVRRNVDFGTQCYLCGGFHHVVRARPTFLKLDALPGKGFFRTDLSFGGPYKSPLIIVDPETKAALEQHKFRGLYFDNAYGIGEEPVKKDIEMLAFEKEFEERQRKKLH